MAGLTILFVLVVSAAVCLAAPKRHRSLVDPAVVRGERAMTVAEVVDYVKRSNVNYMMLPVDDVEMAKRAAEEAFQAHDVLQKQKKYPQADCSQLVCHPVTMGANSYVQCNRVAVNCQK